MSITLDNVIPWGRSMDEYIAMFGLSERDLDARILGCADGPASFNTEMHCRGKTVISVDPIYQFSTEEIRKRIKAICPTILEQLFQNRDDYIWDKIESPESLCELRMAVMDRFLDDFSAGKLTGRYLPHSLPELPFEDQKFDLTLCSHLLFLFSDMFSADFHCRAIQEMLRVSREVRIFPLLSLACELSPHLDIVCNNFRGLGRNCEITSVCYEMQRGANQMLRIN
jgi:hypothetical protein